VLEEEDRRYRVGLITIAWATSALQGKSLVDHSRDLLRRMGNVTGETSFVVVRTDTSGMCIALEESSTPVRHTVDLGHRVPLYVGSTGWVFLAFDPYFADLSLEQMVRYWPETSLDELQVVLQEVRSARESGYAISINSSGMGASGISVPVFDAAGVMIAAMGITGPDQRVTIEMIQDELRPLLLEAAAELSMRLGLISGRYGSTQPWTER
jgi:DNA-binding IclR family transcriptional regulator